MRVKKWQAILIVACMLLTGLVSIGALSSGLSSLQLHAKSSTIYVYSDFTFPGDISEPVIVLADNVVVNGAGYSLLGPGSIGMELHGSNITVKNVRITGWSWGIYSYGYADNKILNNTLINGDSIKGYYLTNWLIDGNLIENNNRGLDLYYSTDNTISNNIVSNNNEGVHLVAYTSGNTISGNLVKDNWRGVALFDYSSDCIVTGNVMENNPAGGIIILRSTNTEIFENTFVNEVLGIYLWFGGTNNLIYHNNFINSYVWDKNLGTNDWHHPVLLEGNYWFNYPGVDDGSGTGKHAIGGDGIGDTSIPWPSTGYDFYPFIEENGWQPTICEDLEDLKQMVIDSDDGAWRHPAENRKNAMVQKIDEAIALCQTGEYAECYDKLLHDIKPKLTGLKEDEEGNPFGNGVFNNPWVEDPALQDDFEDIINPILQALKNQ